MLKRTRLSKRALTCQLVIIAQSTEHDCEGALVALDVLVQIYALFHMSTRVPNFFSCYIVLHLNDCHHEDSSTSAYKYVLVANSELDNFIVYLRDHVPQLKVYAETVIMSAGSDDPVYAGDIAIIGMSCRFPGEGKSVSEFWESISTGQCECIRSEYLDGIESCTRVVTDAQKRVKNRSRFSEVHGQGEG